MILGQVDVRPGDLRVGHEVVERVSAFKYVGVWFSSTTRDVFVKHYDEKSSKACRVACTCFALDDFIGTLAPTEGRMLYMARVDPILTFTSEIVLDVDDTSVHKLTNVQHLFIRQLLHVGSRSVLATLFTETGILPLRFRRANLAIAYLIYLLQLPESHYAHVALRESKSLLRKGFPCWIGDLNWVISHLPGEGASALDIHVENMDRVQLLSLQKSVEHRCDAHLYSILIVSPKCLLLRGWLELDGVVHKLQHCLMLPIIPAH